MWNTVYCNTAQFEGFIFTKCSNRMVTCLITYFHIYFLFLKYLWLLTLNALYILQKTFLFIVFVVAQRSVPTIGIELEIRTEPEFVNVSRAQETIPGLLKRLQIWAQVKPVVPDLAKPCFLKCSVLKFLNNLWRLGKNSNRVVEPARRATHSLAELVPRNRFLGSLEV